MNSRHFFGGTLALLLGLVLQTHGADNLLITEFMAANNGPLTDEDGDTSDWVEIHNAGTNTANLYGWFLSGKPSQLTQWSFPSTNLPPNAYLIVFASGKDRRVSGASLHTNFKLSSNGEFLALVRPDGTTIASAFEPQFPQQVAGVSYGIPVQQLPTTLIASGATARALVPQNGALGSSWTAPSFNDSTWLSVTTGVGYETDGKTPFMPLPLADSVAEFSGVQGQNNWLYGYWDRKNDADGIYSDAEFTPFPNAGGPFSAINFWTGASWDWFNGDPPFTQLVSTGGRPSGDNGFPALANHWAVRRYLSEFEGAIAIAGQIAHTSDWVRVIATGVAANSLIYVYLTGTGDGYIDDMKLVLGPVAESGPNLLPNGDFESATLGPWTVSQNLSGSAISTAVKHSGAQSLHLLSTAAGSTQSSAIWQSISPALVSGQTYTLSYWYRPGPQSSPLVVRTSGRWIETTPIYCGDGTIARIFVDGAPVLQQAVFISSTNYSLRVPIHLGSRVDFALDSGETGYDACDQTTFTASIQTAENLITVADSQADWSFSGTQGEKGWFYGYYNKTADTNTPPFNTYQASDFIPFPHGPGPFGPDNFWDGSSWAWWNGNPPVDEIGPQVMNPTGLNHNVEHWVIRRWLSTVSGTLAVDWTLTKLGTDGAGVTARILRNGTLVNSFTFPGATTNSLSFSVLIPNVQFGDAIDIALDPAGLNGGFGDGGDRSLLTAVIRGHPTLTNQITSDIEAQMRNVNASAYIRIPFTLADPSTVEFLTLRMKYNDGFVAYLNGQNVASANAPEAPPWNAAATASRSDLDTREYQAFDLTSVRGALRAGANVLAIQGLNASAADADFLILPELIASRVTLDPSAKRYFAPPTPGAVNGLGTTNLGPLIPGATHAPNVPRDNEDLLVTATVLPTFNPLSSVRLIYRIMFSTEVNVPMFDDGAHGDGLAGDGLFAASIPASAAAPGQMVRYYIVATDVRTNTSRFPSYDDPQNSPQYLGTVVFNESLTNPLPVLHLFAQNPTLATNAAGTRCSLFYDDEFYDNVFVNLHGQTTASVFWKRSMNFDLNPGHKFRWNRDAIRVNDFDLLTTMADKAYLRLDLAFETFARAEVPSNFAFPVRVQQNGAFFGVFHLVEKGDDNFLRRVGLDPNGALYKVYLRLDSGAYGGVAEKKTRQDEPYDDLQTLIDGCNQSGPALRNYLYDNIDLPEVINFLATIQLVQNEDCCRTKNYYLYRDTEGTGQWQMLPWDLDLTFGRTFHFFTVDGQTVNGYFDTNIYSTNLYYLEDRASFDFIGHNQPLADALFFTPDTFDMFLRRWSTVQEEFLQTSDTPAALLNFERRVDQMSAQLAPDAALDLAAWGTWTPTQTQAQAASILKTDYFDRRRGWIFDTLRFANGGPYLGPQPTNAAIRFGDIDFNPSSGNQAQEFLQLANPNTYAVDLSGWKISGAVDFTFRGGTVIPALSALYVSPDVRAFRARTTGPRGGQGLFVVGNYQGQLSARGETLQLFDKTGRLVAATNFPGNPSPAQQFLRVTEIMYHPAPPPPGLATNADEFEFLEVKNIGPVSLNLAGVRFVRGVEFSFSGSLVTNLPPGASAVVVRNLAAFTSRYGPGLNVAGSFAGSLDNQGENLRLEDASGEVILDFDYDNKWYPITDGLGFSLVIVDDTAPWSSWGLKSSWRTGSAPGGSPGQPNPLPPSPPALLITEALTHTDLPALDTIELFNPTAGPVDLNGWYLSDDFNTPRKYRIQNRPSLPPGGFATFDENDFNALPGAPGSFSLSSKGDEAYLFSADAAGNLTGYYHGFAFGAAANGVTFGRYVTSMGQEHFVAQISPTLGGPNSGPLVGPVVISELHYHPPDLADGSDNSADEFVELQNITAAAVALFDPLHPTNTWQLRGVVDFDFPTNLTLASGAGLVVVNFNPTNTAQLADFRARFGLPAGVPVLGPYSGKLDNSSGTVKLSKPDGPDPAGVPYVLVDEVDYADTAPWPGACDGAGPSLQRLAVTQYGNDPINWTAAVPSPGRPYRLFFTQEPQSLTVPPGSNVTFTVSALSTTPIRYQWRLNGTNLLNATNASLRVTNVLLAQAGDYQVIATDSTDSLPSAFATLKVITRPILSGAQLLDGGRFRLVLSGFSNQSYIIDFSTNLLDWTQGAILYYSNGLVPWMDATATNSSQRFYRGRLAP